MKILSFTDFSISTVIHRLFNFYYNSSDASVKDYTSSHETTIRKRGNT